ncbi:uncharacterized protein METZ01_LOCUS486484, partial [marine metagenome]
EGRFRDQDRNGQDLGRRRFDRAGRVSSQAVHRHRSEL